jgi:hypothetical protein
MELKIAGLSDKLQLNAGITLQPTYITGSGSSYLPSADKLDYSKDASLLNSWNLNTGFETFISYKTSNGFTWQLGPQFRYQFFSTYSKAYTVDENLSNYGIKIGVSKTLY